jgi:hypothetical protein
LGTFFRTAMQTSQQKCAVNLLAADSLRLIYEIFMFCILLCIPYNI